MRMKEGIMLITRSQFAFMLLGALGIEPTEWNIQLLVSWMEAEGSQASYNPLDTTLDQGKWTYYNTDGVKNYETLITGIDATSDTLLNYPDIIDALKTATGPIDTDVVSTSKWGTEPFSLVTLNDSKVYTVPVATFTQPTVTYNDISFKFPTLNIGSTGSAVKGVQTILRSIYGSSIAVDGIYGPITQNYVKSYQEHRKLVVDGIVGPITWTSLIGTEIL